jgi:hypothetical protein
MTMATWRDVEKFIRANYTIIPDAPQGMIAMSFGTQVGRSQTVLLSEGGNDQMGATVQISSIIGKLSSTKIVEACNEVAQMVVGGVVQIGDLTVLRHSVLLENLDENELVKPLLAVTWCADQLEKKLTGYDRA